MGTSFQGTVKIRDGKIKYLSKGKNFVQINSEKKSYFFGRAFALPGFSDSHGHIAAFGSKLNGLDLSQCKSAQDCVQSAINKPNIKGNWIVGFGWNNEIWKKKSFPDKKILDKYFPDIPVCFTRIDGHLAWVNSAALKIAEIDRHTKNPPCGIIEKYKSGEPKGLLHDDAIDLVKNLIPSYSTNQLKANIISACTELVKYGITAVHDMDVHPDLLVIFKELDMENKIPLRIFSFVSGHKNEWLQYKVKQSSFNMLNICGVKFYADGSLGSRSAALLEDYSDKKGQKGIFLIDENNLQSKVIKALSANFNVAVHAIGDAANRMVLNSYNNILEKINHFSKLKLRVEHAQHIHPDDLRFFQDTKIIPSIQPLHCISDAATISNKRLGKRCDYAYPWKSLKVHGARIISGSDFPIESPNPLSGIEALTKRIPAEHSKPWYESEVLDIETAVQTYVCSPHTATASYLPLGDIREGFLADLVILDEDIFSYKETSKINVLATFVNGERVF